MSCPAAFDPVCTAQLRMMLAAQAQAAQGGHGHSHGGGGGGGVSSQQEQYVCGDLFWERGSMWAARLSLYGCMVTCLFACLRVCACVPVYLCVCECACVPACVRLRVCACICALHTRPRSPSEPALPVCAPCACFRVRMLAQIRMMLAAQAARGGGGGHGHSHGGQPCTGH